MADENIILNPNPIDWTTRDTGFIPELNDTWCYYNNSAYPNTIIYLIGDGINTIDNLTLYTPMNDQDQKFIGLMTLLDNLTLGNGSGTETLTFDSGGSSAATITMKAGGFTRWNIQRNSSSGDFNIDKYNATGVFENRPINIDSATDAITIDQESVVLTNGAADGTNLVFRSSASGTDWIIDHSSGSMRFIYGSIMMNIASSGNVTISNDLYIAGVLSKGSGSFKIDHPLKPDTHHLIHSFVESPYADNIYSGMVTLKKGKAKIDIDKIFNMTKGTFEALNTSFRRTTSNESGFAKVISKLDGAVLTIEAEDKKCTDEIFWQVIGERHDKHMLDTQWTDKKGRVVIEPLKSELTESDDYIKTD